MQENTIYCSVPYDKYGPISTFLRARITAASTSRHERLLFYAFLEDLFTRHIYDEGSAVEPPTLIWFKENDNEPETETG